MEGTNWESSDDESIIIKRQIERPSPNEEGKAARKETENLNKFTMVARSKALIDAMEEDELSSDEEVKDSLIIVEETIKGGPISFEGSYFHSEEKHRECWRGAIKKELESMEKCKFWTMINKKEMPEGRKLVGN
jgi:hypothetical protein